MSERPYAYNKHLLICYMKYENIWPSPIHVSFDSSNLHGLNTIVLQNGWIKLHYFSLFFGFAKFGEKNYFNEINLWIHKKLCYLLCYPRHKPTYSRLKYLRFAINLEKYEIKILYFVTRDQTFYLRHEPWINTWFPD